MAGEQAEASSTARTGEEASEIRQGNELLLRSLLGDFLSSSTAFTLSSKKKDGSNFTNYYDPKPFLSIPFL